MSTPSKKDKPLVAANIKIGGRDYQRQAQELLDTVQSTAKNRLLKWADVEQAIGGPQAFVLQEEIARKTLLPKTKQTGVRVRYSEALDLSKQSNFTAEMTELCFERRSNAWYLISAQRRRIGERKTAHVDVSVPKELEQECLQRFKAGFEVHEQEARSASPSSSPALSLEQEFNAWVRGDTAGAATTAEA